MIIAVTSTGKNLSDAIDSRFGRCKYFLIHDTESKKTESFENPYLNADSAGIRSAGFVAEKKAEALISNNIGPNALSALKDEGIAIMESTGKAEDAVAAFLKGELKPIEKPTRQGHH